MKPNPSFHIIRRLEVTGGFLHGLALDFGEGVNCVIGTRGTGKTTVIEFIRWALNQLPTDAPELCRRIDRQVQANLGTGQITLTIETMRGVRYTVQRTCGKEARVFDVKGDPVAIDIGKGSIFSAEIYSQNQIEDIANDPLFQLKLIDKFVRPEIQALDAKVQTLVGKLRNNASEILKLDSEIGELKDELIELTEVSEKLKAFKVDEATAEKKALQQEIRMNASRDRERRSANRLRLALANLSSGLRAAVAEVRQETADSLTEEALGGPNRELMRQIANAVEAYLGQVSNTVETAGRDAEKVQTTMAVLSEQLQSAHARQDQAYQTLLQHSEEEKGKAVERDQLLRRQAELQENQRRMEERRSEQLRKETARQEMLRELSDLKDERYRLRAQVARMLSDKLEPTIRVRLTPYGNTDPFRDLLVERLKGSGFKYTPLVERLVQRMGPAEFAAIVRRADVAALQEHLEIDVDRGNRIILQLRGTPAVFDMEVVDLHDRPSIELRDGPDYKDASMLSPGQKCTTILPILLLDNAGPLIVDQPEDNIDNAYIYNTIIKSIDKVSGKRQMIFATHNPNLPVLAPAARIVFLESTGRQARVKAVGTVDMVKEDIETLLEGGREAFRKRKEVYGY